MRRERRDERGNRFPIVALLNELHAEVELALAIDTAELADKPTVAPGLIGVPTPKRPTRVLKKCSASWA